MFEVNFDKIPKKLQNAIFQELHGSHAKLLGIERFESGINENREIKITYYTAYVEKYLGVKIVNFGECLNGEYSSIFNKVKNVTLHESDLIFLFKHSEIFKRMLILNK